MELDKALQFAVILAWEDLMKVTEPRLVRVEYRGEPGTSPDYVSVWSVRAGGQQDLVCDYWTWTSPAHAGGVRFRNGHDSDQLAQTLDLIMKNQDEFARRGAASHDGLVLIYPPDGDDRVEAVAWMRRLRSTASNLGGATDARLLSVPSLANRIPGTEPPPSSWTDAESSTALRLGASPT